jgi:hypothetical protein
MYSTELRTAVRVKNEFFCCASAIVGVHVITKDQSNRYHNFILVVTEPVKYTLKLTLTNRMCLCLCFRFSLCPSLCTASFSKVRSVFILQARVITCLFTPVDMPEYYEYNVATCCER